MRFATYDESAKLASEIFGVSTERAEASLERSYEFPHPDLPVEFSATSPHATIIYVRPGHVFRTEGLSPLIPATYRRLASAVSLIVDKLVAWAGRHNLLNSQMELWDAANMYRSSSGSYWLPYCELGDGEWTYYLFYFYGNDWTDQTLHLGTDNIATLNPTMHTLGGQPTGPTAQQKIVSLADYADIQNLVSWLADDRTVVRRANLTSDILTDLPDFVHGPIPEDPLDPSYLRRLDPIPNLTLTRRPESESRLLSTIYQAVKERLGADNLTPHRLHPVSSGYLMSRSQEECDIIIPFFVYLDENRLRYYLIRFTGFAYEGEAQANHKALDPRVVLNDPSLRVINPRDTELYEERDAATPRIATAEESAALARELRNSIEARGRGDFPLSQFFMIDHHNVSLMIPGTGNVVYPAVDMRPTYIANLMELLISEIIPTLSSLDGSYDVPSPSSMYRYSDQHRQYLFPFTRELPTGELVTFLLHFHANDYGDYLAYGTANPEWLPLLVGSQPESRSGEETVTCRRCRATIPLSLSNVITIGTGQTTPWCPTCAESAATRCPTCGDLTQTSSMVQSRSGPVCPSCGQDSPSQRPPPFRPPPVRPARQQAPSGPSIREYHQTDRNWVLRGKPNNGVFYGVELEVIHQSGQTDKYQPAADALVPLKNVKIGNERTAKEWIIVEYDGSLRNRDTDHYYGFEIVFHPVSPEFAYEHEELFGNVLDTLVKNGMISYQSVNFKKPDGEAIDCGIHISVTRDAIPVLSQVKMQKLFYENPDFIWRVSRRREESLKHWARVTPPETEEGDRPTYAQVAKGKVRTIKYMALNFKSEVIEMRIFRGTLKIESMMMDLEFAQAVVEFCTDMRFGLTDMTLPKFLAYICERERDFAYLGSWLREKGMLDGYC